MTTAEKSVLKQVAAYIIHLERASERASQVRALERALPMPVNVMPAVDARAGKSGLAGRYIDGCGWKPRYPFRLSDTEIAVFLSHRKAWARIIEDGLEAGLVLEDDIWLDPERFPTALELALENLEELQWIRFPKSDKEVTGETVAKAGDIRLVRPRQVALGMYVQLIHRTTAARLLEITEQFDRPVDGVLQLTWETGIDTLALQPAPVREIDAELGGSTQSKRRGVGSKLHAEVARALYRRRIAERAARS